MKYKRYTCGNEGDLMLDMGFRMMSLTYKIMDFFKSPVEQLDSLGIKKGDTVIDYGCGPGRYVKKASELVGPDGKVYAADIHHLAVKEVEKKIKKYDLKNVSPVFIKDNRTDLKDNIADMIYALDMFHQISDAENFLGELHRLLKDDGVLIIEDGHQPRNESRSKIEKSGLWGIIEDNSRHLKCNPQ